MKILITAGPTRERIDAVRFITNRSTGKMGYSIAEAAVEAGHDVTLISGPTSLNIPQHLMFIPVESAAEMAEAVKEYASESDAVIMTAAVADYRPVEIAPGKIKKGDSDLLLRLERTEDILAGLGKVKKPNQILVGFAAESDDLEIYARDKLKRKNLDYIVANDISQTDRGFGSDNNAVIVFSTSGERTEIPLDSKKGIARTILKLIFG